MHHVVILIDSDDEKIMGHAISYSVNITRAFVVRHQRVQIEIVANGSGIKLLRADTSPLQQPLAMLRQTYRTLPSGMCDSSRQIAEQKEGHTIGWSTAPAWCRSASAAWLSFRKPDGATFMDSRVRTFSRRTALAAIGRAAAVPIFASSALAQLDRGPPMLAIRGTSSRCCARQKVHDDKACGLGRPPDHPHASAREVLLVNLWAAWCEACRIELPSPERLHVATGDRLQVVAVPTDTADRGRSGAISASFRSIGCRSSSTPNGGSSATRPTTRRR